MIDASAEVRCRLYVRTECPFSPRAIERMTRLAEEDARIRFDIQSIDRGRTSDPRAPIVTPTLVLPDGKRVTGTPSLERLRGILARFLGDSSAVPNKVWFLERNRLFHGVPLDEIEKMAHLFREADYPPNHVIFNEGDMGDAVFLLKTGHVRVYRLTEDGQEATLAVLGPGDMFGELALFDEPQRLTVAQTMDSAHICAASVEDFSSLMRHKPQLTMMVAREIARRRTASETRIAGTAYATVRGRVVAVLRHLAEEHGERLPDGATRIGIRFSHQQIASFAGATREACSTQISRMQRAGVLRSDATHHFVIPDLASMQIGVIDRLIHSALG